MKTGPYKALTLRASSLGDCLMGKYFLENVRAQFPEVQCRLLVGSRAGMIKDLLAGYGWLEVVEVNRRNVPGVLSAWRRLRGQDIVLTQYAERPFSLPSKIFARLVAKAGGFVGFDDASAWNKYLYDRIVPFDGERKSKGMIVEEQKALRAAGLGVLLPELSLRYLEDSAVFTKFRLQKGAYVVAHLFSGSEGRSFSQKKRVEIVRALRAALPATCTLVLTGGTGDSSRAQEAVTGLSNTLDISGRTTIQELINLIDTAQATVALDTGAAHIAAHLRRPLVVMTRTEALSGWWGESMYQNKPHVLCNKRADDTAPRADKYPPSLETIEASVRGDTLVRLL